MTPHYSDDWLTVYLGDCRAVMAEMEPKSVNCVVTSPPYFGLRDYGIEGQLGLEPTPEEYVANLVAVFREVRRVLRSDGTVFLNLGDSYARDGGTQDGGNRELMHMAGTQKRMLRVPAGSGLKPKDRIGIPPRVVLALQADGWWWRDEIVWAKPNPMPSSVGDRTTPAHEMVYLLTKSARYRYDAAAIAEPSVGQNGHDSTGQGYAAPGQTRQRGNRTKVPGGWDIAAGAHGTVHRNGRTAATYRDKQAATPVPGDSHHVVGLNASEGAGSAPLTRNKRSVWTVATQPYPQAHFATFPEALITPMILAGCPLGGTVLDPFSGSGTVALVAQRLERKAILIDLSADYIAQSIERIAAGRSSGGGPAVDMPVPPANDGLWAVRQ